MITCPFDSNQLLDRYCIDLLTKKDVPTGQDFPAFKYAAWFWHFSCTFGGEFVCEGRE